MDVRGDHHYGGGAGPGGGAEQRHTKPSGSSSTSAFVRSVTSFSSLRRTHNKHTLLSQPKRGATHRHLTLGSWCPPAAAYERTLGRTASHRRPRARPTQDQVKQLSTRVQVRGWSKPTPSWSDANTVGATSAPAPLLSVSRRNRRYRRPGTTACTTCHG